jgi:hypothetical protein
VPNVTLFGEVFETESISEFSLLEFAEGAANVDEANGLAALASIMLLLREAIPAKDWPRFSALCRKHKAKTEDLMPIIVEAVQQESERPTERPSVSSDGPVTTVPRSAGDSSSRVIEQYEAEGRPAWALIAKQVQESRAG